MTQTPDQQPPVDPAPGGAPEGSVPSTEPTPPSPPAGKAGNAGNAGKAGKAGKGGKAVDPLRASRTSGFYTAVIGLGIVLVLLIIFIVQNTGDSTVQFLVWDGTAPLAVLLLIATAAGIFLTATASSLRLLQVRRRVKRERKAR